MDFDVRKVKLRMKRNFFLFSLLISLLIGWVTVMLIFPWLERTFSDPSLGGLLPVLAARGKAVKGIRAC